MRAELICDLAVLAILLFFLIRGWRKGFILTLCSLLAFLVALVGARFAADAFSPAVSQVLQPRFAAVIQRQLDRGAQAVTEGKTKTPAEAQTTAPADGETAGKTGADAQELLKSLGFYDTVVKSIQDTLKKSVGDTLSEGAQALSVAAADTVARVLVFIVSFLIILILWRLLSRLLDLATKLPVLHGLNGLLGGALGLAEGALLLFLAAWALRLAGGVLPQETVEKTHLLRFFFETDPLQLITGA